MSDTPHTVYLDVALSSALERRARLHGRSVQAEHHDILQQALRLEDSSFIDAAASMRALTDARAQTPSELLQREGRDERQSNWADLAGSLQGKGNGVRLTTEELCALPGSVDLRQATSPEPDPEKPPTD